MPNPWYDIDNFLPNFSQVDASQDGYGFRLTSLPIELICYTAEFLPEESAVALALTSRAMYGVLGAESFATLDTDQHWRLLLLLERDTDLFAACQQWQILHGPCAPMSISPNRINCCSTSGLLPQGVTPALCGLVAKRYIRRQPYSELLTMAGRTKVYTISDFKLFGTTEMRMIEGNLYLREEILMAPLTKTGDLTSRGASLLNEVTNGFHSHQICCH